MFIIDFDDTLFNTHAFKRARLAALRECGVSDELYWQTYQEARNNHDGIMTYTNERHAEVLAVHGFDYDVVVRALQHTTSNEVLGKFVFPDAVDLLYKLRSLGGPLVLLSLGEPTMQELKVRGSGLHDFFDRTFFVEETKVNVLTHLFSQEPVKGSWLINDKIIESDILANKFPDMKIVLKESETFARDEYSLSPYPHFAKLNDIYDYIARNKK